MQDLTMSSKEEEHDGTGDEEEFKFDEARASCSALRPSKETLLLSEPRCGSFPPSSGLDRSTTYIVGHHVDYDAYWKHVLHGVLMSNIARCGSIGIPGLGVLIGRVTFPHVEFPTANFSTHETQIPPPRLGDYPGWIMELGSPYGTAWHTIPSIVMNSTGVVVDWEDDEDEAGTSRGKGSRGRTSQGGAAPLRRSRHARRSF
ncbi:hypothetical protein GIB67_025117 [Kingdonia uniflora]|uniref:Uncharacterized protein n=1 Tax=Kingdonia uniflora TaxID=39325 RepID=A0A7J7N835_9MAGN|nr:hypothetical protein GIB67_025117 [Kingdonia uniflora]